MKILLAKGLLETNWSFYSIATIAEKSFRLRFIDCHKDFVTGLADAYAAACGGPSAHRQPALTSLRS